MHDMRRDQCGGVDAGVGTEDPKPQLTRRVTTTMNGNGATLRDGDHVAARKEIRHHIVNGVDVTTTPLAPPAAPTQPVSAADVTGFTNGAGPGTRDEGGSVRPQRHCYRRPRRLGPALAPASHTFVRQRQPDTPAPARQMRTYLSLKRIDNDTVETCRGAARLPH